MSFKQISDKALGITQGFFGEAITLKQGTSTKTIKGIFDSSWVESNGVSTFMLTCKILEKDLFRNVQKGDQVVKGSKTYNIQVSQPDGPDALILVLNE